MILSFRLGAFIRHRDNCRDILDGLAKVGFNTNLGPHGTGISSLYFERAGGYYIGVCASPPQKKVSQQCLDTGTCQHIINGDIKIKNGSAIECFTENGLRFVDGTELQADIIVFATG